LLLLLLLLYPKFQSNRVLSGHAMPMRDGAATLFGTGIYCCSAASRTPDILFLSGPAGLNSCFLLLLLFLFFFSFILMKKERTGVNSENLSQLALPHILVSFFFLD